VNNFYNSIISESRSTVLSRLVISTIFIILLFVPYFMGMTNSILDQEYRNDIFAIIFMSIIIWLMFCIVIFLVHVALYCIASTIVWIFTNTWGIDIEFVTKIKEPFIFIFNFVFCKNYKKTLFIKNIFKKRNEKAKELLNS